MGRLTENTDELMTGDGPRTRAPWRHYPIGSTLQSEHVDASLAKIGEASWNMAVDESLFELTTEPGSLPSAPSIRSYVWERPAITVGKGQNCEKTILTDLCQRDGIEIVRRMTGGRGILHGDDLTISMIASNRDIDLDDEAGISEIYHVVSKVFVECFKTLGVEAIAGNEAPIRNADPRGDCFAASTKSDIVDSATKSKILGAALYKRGSRFLLQASVPLRSKEEGWEKRSYFIGETKIAATEDRFENQNEISPDSLQEEFIRAVRHVFSAETVVSYFTSPDRVRTREIGLRKYVPYNYSNQTFGN